jgi:5-methylcytosine-specific restriction endonuclease McrA
MRLLEEFVRIGDKNKPLAYYHPHWTRHSAPLLDHLGAVVDHIEAWATGGAHDEGNFATSCNKCNTRKNSTLAEAYSKLAPGKRVRGRYGEPTHWDGFSSLFLVLAGQGAKLNAGERQWLKELQAAPNE